MQIGTVKRHPKAFRTTCFRRFHGTSARGFTSCGPDENRTHPDLPAREFRQPWNMQAQKENSRRSHPVKNPKPVQGIFIGGLTTWSFFVQRTFPGRGLPLFLCRYCFTGVLAIMWIRRESNPQPFYSATTTSSCRALTTCAGLYGGSHSRPICRLRRTRTFDSRQIPDALPPHT